MIDSPLESFSRLCCNVYARHDGVGCGTFESRLDSKVNNAINPVDEPALVEDENVYSAK